MNKIIVDCKFNTGDVVFFRSDSKGIAYSFGTITGINSMEKTTLTNIFKPIYSINKYGGGIAFISESSLITVETFMNTVKQEQEKTAISESLLNEIAPAPSEME
jgi:hypothetical protein